MDHCCIFGRIVHICSRYYLIRRECNRQECERAIAARRSRWDFVRRKANKPKSLYSCKKKGPRIVKATLRSICCGLFNYLDESIRGFVFVCKQEWINVVSTRSTGFKTNKTLRSVHFGVVVVELINCKCGGIVRNQIW